MDTIITPMLPISRRGGASDKLIERVIWDAPPTIDLIADGLDFDQFETTFYFATDREYLHVKSNTLLAITDGDVGFMQLYLVEDGVDVITGVLAQEVRGSLSDNTGLVFGQLNFDLIYFPPTLGSHTYQLRTDVRSTLTMFTDAFAKFSWEKRETDDRSKRQVTVSTWASS